MPNTETQPEAAKSSPGIDKVDPEKVRARAALLVQHGTDPLLANVLAEDAEQAQIAHDRSLKELKAQREDDAKAPAKKGGK